MTLTDSEMLATWRRILGLDTTTSLAAADRTDGINIDQWLRRTMRDWYLDALDHAPLAALTVTDCPDRATALLTRADHRPAIGSITIPPEWRRICSVQLFGWHKPVEPVPATASLLARLSSDFALPGPAEPVALRLGPQLIVAPVVRSVVETCHVVADPGPDTYELHESLLATIPKTIDFTPL